MMTLIITDKTAMKADNKVIPTEDPKEVKIWATTTRMHTSAHGKQAITNPRKTGTDLLASFLLHQLILN